MTSFTDDVIEGFGFRPRPPVRWFEVKVLARTGMLVGLSAAFSRFADKREQQAGRPPARLADRSGDELWIDYVSDLGDGFHATTSIAHLVAQEDLNVEVDGDEVVTERGSILVMGGDQVYPYASIDEYKDRLVGPYGSVLPEPETHAGRSQSPLLLTVPGNHDWYDGLTAFTRLFTTPGPAATRHQWVGGWRVEQTRSYFATKLVHGWWLWGIDIQLDTYIDNEQLAYFIDDVAPHVRPGDAIILCSAKPSWVASGKDLPDGFDNLDYFENKVIEPTGARLRVALTGDLHHYARYECREGERAGEQKLIAGGAGAYLSATHHLPSELTLPPDESKYRDKSARRCYELAGTEEAPALYPTPATSKALRKDVVRLGLRNGAPFVAVVGAAYALWAFTLLRADRAWSWPEMALRAVLPWGPWLVLVAVFAALLGFTHEKRKTRKMPARVLAFAHTLVHGLAVITLAWLAERAWGTGLGPPLTWWHRLFVALSVGVAGAIVAPLVLAAYLYVADHVDVNSNELFAALRLETYKCFLRLHLDRDGVLTIYPIGVEQVARDWRIDRGVDGATSALIRPTRPLRHHLIEPPIRVTKAPDVVAASEL